MKKSPSKASQFLRGVDVFLGGKPPPPPPPPPTMSASGNDNVAAGSSKGSSDASKGASSYSSINWKYLSNEGSSAKAAGNPHPRRNKRGMEENKGENPSKKPDQKQTPEKFSGKETPAELEEDETPSLTDAELADHLQKLGIEIADPETFADAVETKRKDYPYLVYLQSTKTRRERITFKEFEKFMAFYGQEYKKLPFEERRKVNLDWHDYHMGRGLLAADDEPTAMFLKALIDAFTLDGKVFKGWLKTEFGDRHTYKMWLGGVAWTNQSPSDAMVMIFRTTNALIGEWKITKYEKVPKKGAFAIIEADSKLASSIYYLCGLGHQKRNKASIRTGYGTAMLYYKLLRGGQDDGESAESSNSSPEKEKVKQSTHQNEV